MTSRRTLVVLAVLGAAVTAYLLLGRGQGVAADGPLARHDRGWSLGGSGGSDALIGGPVEYVDGCLLVDGLPVVWPEGYTWDEEQQAIRVSTGRFGDDGWIRPRLESSPVGDTVSGGGGVVGEPPDTLDPDSEIGRALGDCLGSAGVLVFNADSEIDVTKGFS